MTKKKRELVSVRYNGEKRAGGTVVCGEALTFLRALDDEIADIVFLDPPFNLGKQYSDQERLLDRRPEREYELWLRKILTESGRVVKQGGVVFLYHLPIWAMRMGSRLHEDGELEFFHWIAIAMKNGFVRGRRLYPAHYALLLFSKGKPRVFNRPKLSPAKCRHCGRYVKDYGGYTSIIETKGINLSDFWEDLSPVRHATTKNRSANELPQKLFDRVFQMSGRKGGLYVDPFSGSGTGIISAVRAGMKFHACDFLRANCELLLRRLRQR
jgi:site-specific DNA-methyltransferase (adenine-specific)